MPDTAVAAPHVHHWRIEPPNGPTSMGRCRTCGEEREFQNTYGRADAPDTRLCHRCLQEFPTTDEYWPRRGAYGGELKFSEGCKSCRSERQRERRARRADG